MISLSGMKRGRRSNRDGFIPRITANLSALQRGFPLQQANKVRLIDDFSINGINAAYGVREKLRVQSIDELCSYLAYILDHCSDPVALELVGRTFDLKQA